MSEANRINEERASGFAAEVDQFLTFTLKEEEYGIEILRVQEIKGFSKVRPIPNAPPYIRGVMNLRGTVIPIVDLRSRFGMDEVEYNQFTVIIVVSVADKVIGLIVDAVSDVLNIPSGELDSAPEMGNDLDTTYFSGMAKVGEKLVLLLDIDKLLSHEQLQEINTAA